MSGFMQVTLISLRFSSKSESKKALSPALEALYAQENLLKRKASIDEMPMIWA